MIIYKVTNLINGKSYIGQTRQKMSVRWRQHCYASSNSRGVAGAIQKYGKKNFLVTVLFETYCKSALNTAESLYIKEFNTLAPTGYNLTTGGEGGYTRSEETKLKLSLANKGKGRKHTAEARAKMSEASRGNKNPMFGKKPSEEHKRKIAAALLGKKRPDAVRAKISASHNIKSNLNLTHNHNNKE